MSNSRAFIYNNGISIFSLLVFLIVGSGFMHVDHKENSERKKRKKIIQSAQKHIGTKYRAGGKTPKGFDCSGFVYYIMKRNKVKVGASSSQQSMQGEPVKIKNLQKGDLVFFGSKKRISHVGLVVRQNKKELVMIHSSSSRGIVEEDIYKSAYWTKRLRFGRSVL